jgi:hypothetical protein
MKPLEIIQTYSLFFRPGTAQQSYSINNLIPIRFYLEKSTGYTTAQTFAQGPYTPS